MKAKTTPDSVRKIRMMDALPRSGRAGFLALALITSILVTACGGGSLPPSEASPSTQDTSPQATLPQEVSAQATPTQATPTQVRPPQATSPQDVRPGTEEFVLSKQELVRTIDAEESLIASCMKYAGIEYIAVEYNTVRQRMLADKSLKGISELH